MTAKLRKHDTCILALTRLLVFFMMTNRLKCKQALLLSIYLSLLLKYDCHFCLFIFQVYSIGDLRYVNESDLISYGMSKPQFRKIKRHLPSSSNTVLSNNTMLTSTLGKLLVRVSASGKSKL
jgi:hypothetical protein